METLIVGVVTALVTFAGTWMLHKRETSKNKDAAVVATTALATDLNTKMAAHVEFVEARIQAERRWWEKKLDDERQECDDKITELAAKLAHATAGGSGGVKRSR
jgi:hypothetical protein